MMGWTLASHCVTHRHIHTCSHIKPQPQPVKHSCDASYTLCPTYAAPYATAHTPHHTLIPCGCNNVQCPQNQIACSCNVHQAIQRRSVRFHTTFTPTHLKGPGVRTPGFLAWPLLEPWFSLQAYCFTTQLVHSTLLGKPPLRVITAVGLQNP